jgi:hypothetical protein
MKILKELEVLIPPLTIEEFKQLERNILEEGIRDPLVTWNGILVDGHNRYRIATEHDMNYVTVEKEFTDMNAVKEWMIYNQFGRRNLPTNAIRHNRATGLLSFNGHYGYMCNAYKRYY